MASSQKTDDTIKNFNQALVHLNAGTEQLRMIVPSRANEVAQLVNKLSQLFINAIVESEILEEEEPAAQPSNPLQSNLLGYQPIIGMSNARPYQVRALSGSDCFRRAASYESFPTSKRTTPLIPPGFEAEVAATRRDREAGCPDPMGLAVTKNEVSRIPPGFENILNPTRVHPDVPLSPRQSALHRGGAAPAFPHDSARNLIYQPYGKSSFATSGTIPSPPSDLPNPKLSSILGTPPLCPSPSLLAIQQALEPVQPHTQRLHEEALVSDPRLLAAIKRGTSSASISGLWGYLEGKEPACVVADKVRREADEAVPRALAAGSASNLSHSNAKDSISVALLSPSRSAQIITRKVTFPTSEAASSRETPYPSHKVQKSWANIVAAPTIDATGSRSGHTRSGNTMTLSETKKPRPVSQETAESPAKQKRTVWLYNCPLDFTLHDVSENIKNCILISLRFVPESELQHPDNSKRVVFIVFQSANAAQHFASSCYKKMKYANQPSGYVRDIHARTGELYPEDEIIRSTHIPTSARRRLLFVKAQMFVTLHPITFKRDMENLAGAENIQLIWLYNCGNAFVVFSSVEIAGRVLLQVNEWAKTRGKYAGVCAMYTKDPCEQDMRLFSTYDNGVPE
ncbi:MAG: hypothetical protein M1827_003774 [Pycnora praestabilis]|nr:MAG: hypothetical protein M1827_003774 [Pycnora praestabilis]